VQGFRAKLHRFHSKLNRVLTPGLKNPAYAYFDAVEEHLTDGARWLDIGCGHQMVPSWMLSAGELQDRLLKKSGFLVGIDCDQDSLRQNRVTPYLVHSHAGKLPFGTASFDLVTANMVVEHVQDPIAILSEIRRILKPRGVFVFHTPNFFNPNMLLAYPIPQKLKNYLVRFFEGRCEDDVFPTFYRMNSRVRIKRLAAASGFGVLDCRLVNSSPTTYMLGPLVAIELLFIRMTRYYPLSEMKSNIVCALQNNG